MTKSFFFNWGQLMWFGNKAYEVFEKKSCLLAMTFYKNEHNEVNKLQKLPSIRMGGRPSHHPN